MYKCVIVTPAGRRRYIEILFKYLKSQKNSFDKWQLWLNTQDHNDIQYMRKLEEENDWIVCIKPSWPYDGTTSIIPYFQYTKEEDTIYIRLDDDIVYLSPNFVDELKLAREKYTDPLFVFPNIINNAIVSYIHYKNKLIDFETPLGYDCVDKVGWNNSFFCEKLHKTFLDDIKENNLNKWASSFDVWKANNYERISINCMAWFGKDMKNIAHQISYSLGEEIYLACVAARNLNRPNIIIGSPICAHFAFFVQREHIEKNTNILARYSELASELNIS